MNRTFRTFSLFVVTVFSVVIFSSRVTASPVTQPIPLRIMHLKSDLVFIGTVSVTGEWEPVAQGDSKTVYRRSLTLTVETPIKGMAPGEIAASEIRAYGKTNGEFAESAQRRLFFLGKQDNSYYLLGNFHDDLPLNGRELDVYAARLRELQNIYLSGGRIDEQIMDWLTGLAADPVTRFDGAYDLKTWLGIAGPASVESGTSIDPSGKPEGSAIDPNGRSSATEESDVGSRLDPNGRPVSENRDQGGGLDPDGKPSSAKGDQGSMIDPDGRAKGEQGPGIDPDGKVKGDQGGGTDPDGKSSCLAKGDEGCGMDPNGKGLGVDPNGKSSVTGKDDGRGIDPNGKGLGVDPNGKSSVTGKDDGRGIDPNGRGIQIDPNGRGIQIDPNGKGLGIDPNGKTGDDKDAGVRIDPEGRSFKGTRSREAGVIIDPNGRGSQIDPNGKTGDDKDAGPRIDPEGRSLKSLNSLNSTRSREAGVIIDPNGKQFSALANERDSGTSLDPSGRLFTAANKEKLIQAFLAAGSSRAPLSEGDLALLSVVSTFHDSRVNIVLAAQISLLTADSGRAATDLLDAAARSFGDERLGKLARLYALTFPANGGQNMRGGVDEWDGDILKRNSSSPAVDEWDSDVVKRDAIDQWDSDVVKRTASASREDKRVDEWDSEVVKRGLSGDALRAKLLRLINARMLLLVRGE
jgi:hypothetical protein